MRVGRNSPSKLFWLESKRQAGVSPLADFLCSQRRVSREDQERLSMKADLKQQPLPPEGLGHPVPAISSAKHDVTTVWAIK